MKKITIEGNQGYLLPKKEVLPLVDHYWSEEGMSKTLTEANFTIENIIELNEKNLPKELQKTFNRLVEQKAKEYNISWKDEWEKPLYQIIIARK